MLAIFYSPSKTSQRLSKWLRALLSPAVAVLLTHCGSTSTEKADVIVSVKDQRMGIYRNGSLAASYKVSTSKFGLGDKPGSCCTPLGKHEIIAKIGHGLPKGAVLHNRHWSGEVLKPNAPGRDPIVSRILWLGGLESGNRNAANRFIYIHGTAEENRIGTPASYGCVRMKSNDVVAVFERVSIGDTVLITKNDLPSQVAIETHHKTPIPPTTAPLDVTSSAIAHAKTTGSSRDAVPTLPTSPPHAIPVSITPDGRVIPIQLPTSVPSSTSPTKKKGEPVRTGSPSNNGRQTLRLPVTRSA